MIGITPQELAERVMHRIEHEPETVDMTAWIRRRRGVMAFSGSTVDHAAWAVADIRRGGCATVACVAGWTCIEAIDMGADLEPFHSIDLAASRLLGIRPYTASTEGEHLFDPENDLDDVRRLLQDVIDRD